MKKPIKRRPVAVPILPDLHDIVGKLTSRIQRNDKADFDSMLQWRRSPNAHFVRLRAALFPASSSQPKDLIELLRHAGMEEVIGPISWTMRMLARRPKINGQDRRRVVSVPVDHVLSSIWSVVRVANIFERSALGTRPPPVDLSWIRFKNENFYIVEDGHHRCETVKMTGMKAIRSEINEERLFVPSDWLITKRGFKHVRTARVITAAKDLQAAARWLGVSDGRPRDRTRPRKRGKS